MWEYMTFSLEIKRCVVMINRFYVSWTWSNFHMPHFLETNRALSSEQFHHLWSFLRTIKFRISFWLWVCGFVADCGWKICCCVLFCSALLLVYHLQSLDFLAFFRLLSCHFSQKAEESSFSWPSKVNVNSAETQNTSWFFRRVSG